MDVDFNKSLLHLLHRASQAANDLFEHNSASDGVTARQLVVRTAISTREGMSQTDIVELTGIDRSTLADIVRRVLKAGLIVRKRSKVDARAYQVGLTSKGRNVLGEATQVAARTETHLAESLKARQRDDLVRLLQILVDASLNAKAAR